MLYFFVGCFSLADSIELLHMMMKESECPIWYYRSETTNNKKHQSRFPLKCCLLTHKGNTSKQHNRSNRGYFRSCCSS